MLNFTLHHILHLLAHHVGQFVSVLYDSWHAHRTLPIPVIEALPVRQLPECFLAQVRGVVNQLVVGGCGRTRCDILCDHFELVALLDDLVGHDCATRRID